MDMVSGAAVYFVSKKTLNAFNFLISVTYIGVHTGLPYSKVDIKVKVFPNLAVVWP